MTSTAKNGELSLTQEAIWILGKRKHLGRSVGNGRLAGFSFRSKGKRFKIFWSGVGVLGNSFLIRVNSRNPQVSSCIMIDSGRQENPRVDILTMRHVGDIGACFLGLIHNLTTEKLLHQVRSLGHAIAIGSSCGRQWLSCRASKSNVATEVRIHRMYTLVISGSYCRWLTGVSRRKSGSNTTTARIGTIELPACPSSTRWRSAPRLRADTCRGRNLASVRFTRLRAATTARSRSLLYWWRPTAGSWSTLSGNRWCPTARPRSLRPAGRLSPRSPIGACVRSIDPSLTRGSSPSTNGSRRRLALLATGRSSSGWWRFTKASTNSTGGSTTICFLWWRSDSRWCRSRLGPTRGSRTAALSSRTAILRNDISLWCQDQWVAGIIVVTASGAFLLGCFRGVRGHGIRSRGFRGSSTSQHERKASCRRCCCWNFRVRPPSGGSNRHPRGIRINWFLHPRSCTLVTCSNISSGSGIGRRLASHRFSSLSFRRWFGFKLDFCLVKGDPLLAALVNHLAFDLLDARLY